MFLGGEGGRVSLLRAVFNLGGIKNGILGSFNTNSKWTCLEPASQINRGSSQI